MKASALEFRLRMAINAAIVVLGFTAPWIELLGVGRRMLLLEWLALELSRLGLLSFRLAIPTVLAFAALLAGLGAFLRIWGAAWLGHTVVQHSQMKAGTLAADGPFRFLRNPLYVGLYFTFAALAFLMPVSGAVFVLLVSPVFLLRLILGEEAFLADQLGQPYRDYLRAIPRLLPRLSQPDAKLPSSGEKPSWLHAALSELTPIGVFLSFAVFSWSYDTRLMGKAIVVCFGLSLVVRALLPGDAQKDKREEP